MSLKFCSWMNLLDLDVNGRKKIWEHIRMLKAEGMTIFMTTHYLEEAEKYCNRVAIIDKGKVSRKCSMQGWTISRIP